MAAHIVLDVRHWRDFGYGTYIRNLVRAMCRLETPFRFSLIAKQENLPEFSFLPPHLKPVVYDRSDRDRRDNVAFPLFLRSLKPDLVHIPLNSVPVFLPKPFVVTIHDMSSVVMGYRGQPHSRLHLLRFRLGLVRASRVIAVSESTRQDVVQLMNIPDDRVRRIYNAIDPDYYAAGSAEERRQTMERYQIGHPYLLYAGSVKPQKNVARIVEAFSVVRRDLAGHPRFKDLRLVIIGDEISKYPRIRQAVVQSRVREYVRFLGFVPSDALRSFYQGAEAFVFPSLYEGFGLPPLEAMAAGTPVITSNVSSLPEVVGDAASFVKPENVFDIARGVKEVLLEEDLRQRMVSRGLEQVRQFSWTQTARQVLETYQNVLDERRR